MILSGDCVEVMRGLDDESVDAIVTDPPYGLGFMGKAWDDLPPGLEWAQECLRVLKPGGHLLAFGGSRTYHRLAVAVEDAGFEVRDQMMWLYGSGFPKSLDVSKAIDKAAGAEREVVGKHDAPAKSIYSQTEHELSQDIDLTAPATEQAHKWDGWGTALKPAHEPIVVARKPLVGTVAENVLKFGTGALNVDGCRIEHDGTGQWGTINRSNTRGLYGSFGDEDGETPGSVRNPAGRWPANLILDEEAGRLLDEQSGEGKDGVAVQRNLPQSGSQSGHVRVKAPTQRASDVGYGSSGGASRFFYCAKAGKAERNAGLDGFEERESRGYQPLAQRCRECGCTSVNGNASDLGIPKMQCGHPDTAIEFVEPKNTPTARNIHPTVKPISLMAYLVRLVTPPAGTVLDPFLGSGTTGCAAVLEGFDFIGIEREADYIAIAEARIAWWEKHKGDAQVGDILAAGKDRDEVEDAGQLDLLADAA